MPDESEEDPVRGLIAILAGLAVLLVGFFSTISILERWQAGTVAAIAVGCAGILLALGLGACTTAAVSLALAAVERRFGHRCLPSVAVAVCAASLLRLAQTIYHSRFDVKAPYELVMALIVGPLLLAAVTGVAKLWRKPRRSVRAAPLHQQWGFRQGMLLLLLCDTVITFAAFSLSDPSGERIGTIIWYGLGGGNWLLIRYFGYSPAKTCAYMLLYLTVGVVAAVCFPGYYAGLHI